MSSQRQHRIAFGHKARVGKDTAAAHLIGMGFRRIAFADALYQCTGAIQSILGKPIEKDRRLLQELGMLVRHHYGANTWVDCAMASVLSNPDAKWCCSDVRFRNEADTLRKNGFLLVKIVRNEATAGDDAANAHASERELDDYDYDVVIENNGTLEEFLGKIDALIASLA